MNLPKNLVVLNCFSVPIVPNGNYTIKNPDSFKPSSKMPSTSKPFSAASIEVYKRIDKMFESTKKKEIYMCFYSKKSRDAYEYNPFDSSYSTLRPVKNLVNSDKYNNLIHFEDVKISQLCELDFSTDFNVWVQSQDMYRNMKKDVLINTLMEHHKDKIHEDLVNQLHPFGTICMVTKSKTGFNILGLYKVKLNSFVEISQDLDKVLVELSHIYNNETVAATKEFIKKDYYINRLLNQTKQLVEDVREILLNSADRYQRKPIVNYEFGFVHEAIYYVSNSQFLQNDQTIEDLHNSYQKEDIREVLELLQPLLIRYKEEAQFKVNIQKNIVENEKRSAVKDVMSSVKQMLNENENSSTNNNKKLKKIYNKFQSMNYNKRVPESAVEIFEEEYQRVSSMDSNHTEYQWIVNYLDILSKIPWGVRKKETLHTVKAMQVLNEKHYGMKLVKERICQLISVGRLNNKINGKILCLIGPPGVGKTSIAKSISKALNLNEFKISLGGQSDVAELKGHRRTYVGSQPGKIIQALIRTKSYNPLIILDEIDKVGSSKHMQGDLAGSLLDILDFSQNDHFVDNYVDVPVDLSNIFFVCTANYKDQILPPLRDRLEFIELSGYTDLEKHNILDQYLIPKSIKACGLFKFIENQNLFDNTLWSFNEDVRQFLIERYARESGVRSLEKYTNRIFEWISYQIVSKIEQLEILEIQHEETEDKYENLKSDLDKLDKKQFKDINQKNSNDSMIDNVTGKFVIQDKSSVNSDKFEIDLNDLKNSNSNSTTNSNNSRITVTIKNSPEENEIAENKVHIIYNQKLFKYINQIEKQIVTEDLIVEILGHSPFIKDKMYDPLPVGVACGLAYSEMGGSLIYIECNRIPTIEKEKGSFKYTGNMGKTMEESTEIAFTYAKSLYHELKTEQVDVIDIFDDQIHVHIPDGATKKDGPSAGVTLVTVLSSLLLNQPVSSEFAMTGEISLQGKVLPVGGLKEKIVSGNREGIYKFFLPYGNKNTIMNLVKEYKDLEEKNTFYFVKDYREILKILYNV